MIYKVVANEISFLNAHGGKVRATKNQVVEIERRIDAQALLKEKKIKLQNVFPQDAIEEIVDKPKDNKRKKYEIDDLVTVTYEEKETTGVIKEVKHAECVVEIQPNSDDNVFNIVVKKKEITVIGQE